MHAVWQTRGLVLMNRVQQCSSIVTLFLVTWSWQKKLDELKKGSSFKLGRKRIEERSRSSLKMQNSTFNSRARTNTSINYSWFLSLQVHEVIANREAKLIQTRCLLTSPGLGQQNLDEIGSCWGPAVRSAISRKCSSGFSQAELKGNEKFSPFSPIINWHLSSKVSIFHHVAFHFLPVSFDSPHYFLNFPPFSFSIFFPILCQFSPFY